MLLIADSGSTKTTWVLINEDRSFGPWETIGLNPFFHDEQSISGEIEKHLLPKIKEEVKKVSFYGSGCYNPENSKKIRNALQNVFPDSHIDVDHDLLGASRSLCLDQPGIVCILGTGSSSCLYNGTEIIQNQTSLGYILGDEGSGAVMGMNLIKAYLYKKLPRELSLAFESIYPMDLFEILNHVYMKPFPNRFLAKFAKFLYDHKDHDYVHEMILSHFSPFLKRNVIDYNRSDVSTHFLGSIAFHFKDFLSEACDNAGIITGNITDNPIPGLTQYHRRLLNKSS